MFDSKLGVLDIRAKINDFIDCDVEMQVVDYKNIEKRILFYLSSMYSQNIKQGTDYSNITKCVAILFTDFEIENIKSIKKYITKWNFREETYSKIILTDSKVANKQKLKWQKICYKWTLIFQLLWKYLD